MIINFRIMMKFVNFSNIKCEVNDEEVKQENVINDNERSIAMTYHDNITTTF